MNINKNKDVLNPNMEGTPFVWKDKLMYFVSERGDKPESIRLSIFDFNTRKRVKVFAENQELALGSVFADGALLYTFVTKNAGVNGKSEIYMIQSNDLQTFSNPKLIYRAPEKQAIFNTSVTKNTDTGEYILAFETSTQGELWPFTIYFLRSKDLTHWSLIADAVFGKDIYVASPTIKYINNHYYLWFLMKNISNPNCIECMSYVTKISRSKNLLKWESSPHAFMVADREDEGINTSDVDLVEFADKVYILYAVGDQSSWTHMKYAVYNGSIQELVNNYFPIVPSARSKQ